MPETKKEPDQPEEEGGPLPWERQDQEPSVWYGRFHRYLLLGIDRSLLRLYTDYRRKKWEQKGGKKKGVDAESGDRKDFSPPSSVPESWSRAAAAWQWEIRAEAFDDEQRAQDEKEWKAKQSELRRKEWELSDLILDALKSKLEKLKGEVDDLKPIDVARYLKLSSDLGRRASELPSDRFVQLGDMGLYSDEQIEKIRRGENPGPPEGLNPTGT